MRKTVGKKNFESERNMHVLIRKHFIKKVIPSGNIIFPVFLLIHFPLLHNYESFTECLLFFAKALIRIS